MAIHAPITPAAFRAPVIRVLPLHRRVTIEAEIEQHLHRVDTLLARLDRADAPFEDFEDDDPAGDTLDEHGEHPVDDGRELLSTLPLYAVDQTTGPINERSALRQRHHQQHRLD